jgi:hypothetical protein
MSKEILDLCLELAHDGVPARLRWVFIVPVEVVVRVFADAVLPLAVVVHLPAVAVWVELPTARLELVREVLGHRRTCNACVTTLNGYLVIVKMYTHAYN